MKKYLLQGILLSLFITIISCGKAPPTNSASNPFLRIYVPNVIIFTDEDLNNFYPRSTSPDTWVEELAVFDNWGNLVFWNEAFPANEAEYGWNGYVDGEEALSGAYTYSIHLREGKDELTFIGDLTIIN